MIKAAVYDCSVLSDPALYYEAYGWISPDRRKRADEIKAPSAKIMSVGASHMLEMLLWECKIAGPYEYEYSELGKPYLKGREDIHISLSHSNSWALCAVSDKPIGVDIEKVTYKENVANRFFTKADREILADVPESEKASAFTQIWTYKEAMAKLLGKSAVQVLQWIDFSCYRDEYFKDRHIYKSAFTICENMVGTICSEEEFNQSQLNIYNFRLGRYLGD